MSQYIRRKGKTIVNTYNQEFLLKGVGIGGWLFFEGYMFKSTPEIDRQWKFEAFLDSAVGIEERISFLQKFKKVFFTEADINMIKSQGFNSIRVPLDYQFLFEASDTNVPLDKIQENWCFLDEVIRLCKRHDLYVILDLHCAPGGQTGANIDNSKNDIPEMFINPLYRAQTIYVWEELAKHYVDETIIACYDILNEPIPHHHSKYNDQLLPFYKDVLKAIRNIDTHHLITLEGIHWATDLSIFKEVLDDNLLLQFHKYWNNPDIDSIQPFLDKREALNLPIFMGEGGENELHWYAQAFKMFEQLKISYNFWTYKKMDNINSIVSFDMPHHWNDFLHKKLTKDESIEVLNELLSNISFEKSKMNQQVINQICNRQPFEIPASGYDFYGKEKSFHILYENDSSYRKSDGVRILNANREVIKPDFWRNRTPKKDLFVYLEKNEWVTYSFYKRENPCYISIDCNELSDADVYINDILIKPSKDNTYVFNSKTEKNMLKISAKKPIRLETIFIK